MGSLIPNNWNVLERTYFLVNSFKKVLKIPMFSIFFFFSMVFGSLKMCTLFYVTDWVIVLSKNFSYGWNRLLHSDCVLTKEFMRKKKKENNDFIPYLLLLMKRFLSNYNFFSTLLLAFHKLKSLVIWAFMSILS